MRRLEYFNVTAGTVVVIFYPSRHSFYLPRLFLVRVLGERGWRCLSHHITTLLRDGGGRGGDELAAASTNLLGWICTLSVLFTPKSNPGSLKSL